jgi:hypothetical protein
MNTKKIYTGLALLISFFVILLLIFMPIFGNGRNGLQFADDFFNSLSKYSSNNLEAMTKLAKTFEGQNFAVAIKPASAAVAPKVTLLYTKAGAEVVPDGEMLKISGDLGKVLSRVVADSTAMFNNQGEKLVTEYNYDAKSVMRNWWTSLGKVATALNKQQKFKQSKAIETIQTRAIEPGYNFYGIEASSVRENAAMLTFMLLFYIVYTLWYGYGIFELFEGIGLGMHKGGSKEEV